MMKNIKYYTIVLGAILTLILSAIGVSADSVTDSVDDVYHYAWSETGFSWQVSTADKPNIDITEISYSVEDTKLVLSLTVAGTITNSEFIAYWAYLNTSDSNYLVSWNNGSGFGFATNTDPSSYEIDYEPEITASGNTITASYDVIGTFQTGIELYGWAAEYTSYGDTSHEWWGDWAPASYEPFDEEDLTGDGDDDGTGDGSEEDQNTSGDGTSDIGKTTGTPGFELITVFLGVLFVIYMIWRRK
jgi:hypothetical protein